MKNWMSLEGISLSLLCISLVPGCGSAHATAQNAVATSQPPPSATSNQSSTVNSPAPSPSVSNSQVAVELVKSAFTSDLAADSNLRVVYDHATQLDGHTVYVVHVFDSMPDHTATIDWVDVRDDGMLQSETLQQGWTTPKDYKNANGLSAQPVPSTPPSQPTLPMVNATDQLIGKTIPELQDEISTGQIFTTSTFIVQSATGIGAFGGALPNVNLLDSDAVFMATSTSGGISDYLVVRSGAVVVDLELMHSGQDAVNNALPPVILQVSPEQITKGNYVLLRWQLNNAILEALTVPTGKGNVNYYPVIQVIAYAPSVGSN